MSGNKETRPSRFKLQECLVPLQGVLGLCPLGDRSINIEAKQS